MKSVFWQTPSWAATNLVWGIDATPGGSPEIVISTAAWAIRNFNMTVKEKEEFLSTLGLIERPTPQGSTEIVSGK